MSSSEKRRKRAEREEKRGKRAERDERRETGGETREKSEERREKREERREKREERREKREEMQKKAARDPQMRPREVPNEVPRGLWASWRPDRVRGRDGEATGRPPKKTNELPRVCFPTILKISGCYEDGRQLESLYFYKVP